MPASTLKMALTQSESLRRPRWLRLSSLSQESWRLTGDGDSGYEESLLGMMLHDMMKWGPIYSGYEVKSLQDVKSPHDMMKWGHRYKYAPQFWCALSVQLESLAQEEKKREEVIKAARLALEKRRASEAAEALAEKRWYLFGYFASDEYDASRDEHLARLMSENKALRAHRAKLNRIILNYLKLRHPQFHDGVRSSRQYYEEKDCTKPIVQVKTTQENWPLTADGDHGHHAMDDKRKESKKLQSQLMARDPKPNIKYYTKLQRYRMHYMQEREIVHRDLKPSNPLVANPVDCPSKTGFVYAKVVDFESKSVVGTGFFRAPEIPNCIKGRLSTRHTVLDSYATPKTDIYSYAMTCYEILTGKSPFGTKELPYARMSSGRTRPDLPVFPRIWTTEEIGALLKTSLLAPKQDGGPDWDYVSEILSGEYGIDRAAISCKNHWGGLLRCYNAIRDHELKIYNGTKNGPSYFEMDEEERLRNMLPPVFDLEWCKMMETILKAKPGEVQSGTTADECTGLSNDEDVLCGEDEAEDESCESAVSEVEDSTADSYVPQTETRGKDLPESPSQQMVPAVASGGKRKADMDVDREAKKLAV